MSIIAIAVLLVLIVVSVRKQRAMTADEDAELEARLGTDDAQAQRAAASLADVRAARD